MLHEVREADSPRMQPLPLTFESHAALAAGLAVAAVAVGVGLYRRPAVPRASAALAVASLLLLAAAAGGPAWRRSAGDPVVVMVDLSPSTRGADYRNVAALRDRVRRLLGDTPNRTVYFAGDAAVPPADQAAGPHLPDMPADQTVWAPAAGAAVVLFSDVQFQLPPFAPPTFIVVDAAMEQPADAAVERMEVRAGDLTVTARNSGSNPRPIQVSTGLGPAMAEESVGPGGAVMSRPLPPQTAGEVTAQLARGDLWPENDTGLLVPPPPPDGERWWVGGRSAGEGWRTTAPADLPLDGPAYLRPSVIVLDNVAASDLGEGRIRRLRQYVAELGGGLVILGGDSSFAAGGYAGTALDALSPLAPHPPEPSTHWVFLVDSSGSMSSPVPAGGTRWTAAADAAARAAASLPPQDPVSVGGFAATVEWWVRSKPASALAGGSLPPAGTRASGPTELRRALESAASLAPAGPPVELILLTDANAPVDDPASLAAVLREKRVRLHMLDIGGATGEGLAALRQLVDATGGTPLGETDPAGWAAAARRLTRAAAADRLVRAPARVQFLGPLAGTPPRTAAAPWNRTWLKPGATSVGAGPADQGPLAATWEAGEGRVVAAGFSAPPDAVSPFVRLAGRAPRDPRLRVEWESGTTLRVTVNATAPGDGGGPPSYLNALTLTLEVRDASGAGSAGSPHILTVPQVAPGRYELAAAAPSGPAFATLRSEGRAVERVAIASRYPAEFSRIGNDRRAMQDLADRTGGAVIEPSATGPLPPSAGRRTVSLTSAFATAAAACLGAALIRWRVG